MENEIIKTEEAKPVNGAYKQLLTDIGQLIADGRKQVLSAVNTAMFQMYWGIGQHIVEYEQKGEVRAQYGKSLLSTISKDLTQLYGLGFNRNNLQYMRKLYMAFPNCTTLSCNWSWSHHQQPFCRTLSTILAQTRRLSGSDELYHATKIQERIVIPNKMLLLQTKK